VLRGRVHRTALAGAFYRAPTGQWAAMEAHEHEDTERPDPDEAGESAPDDERGAGAPSEGADPEPTPGEDPGPHGNPAQDEEGLSHEQQDSG